MRKLRLRKVKGGRTGIGTRCDFRGGTYLLTPPRPSCNTIGHCRCHVRAFPPSLMDRISPLCFLCWTHSILSASNRHLLHSGAGHVSRVIGWPARPLLESRGSVDRPQSRQLRKRSCSPVPWGPGHLHWQLCSPGWKREPRLLCPSYPGISRP